MRLQIGEDHYKIQFEHQQPNRTLCWILKNEEVVANGWADCAESDVYVKEVGRKISLTRAVKDFPREVRTLFWAAYLHRSLIATAGPLQYPALIEVQEAPVDARLPSE